MKLVFICIVSSIIALTSCRKKEKIEFTLNTLTLKALKKDNLPNQKLFIKVIKKVNSVDETLSVTDKYPSELTLPAKFGLEHSIKMNFYKYIYIVSVYGDSSGFIGSNSINIKDYKILYPIDMETEKDGISIVLSGTWK